MSAQPETITTAEFEIDGGCINYGNDYEEKCVSLFTLKLLNERTVEDFWLTSNMEGMKPFDDLFICTIENGLKNIYFVQIKHTKNRDRNPLRDYDFVNNKSKLMVKKFSGYQTLLDENSHRYPREFQPADRVRIIVFTNRPVDPDKNTTLERFPDYHFLQSTSNEIYTVRRNFLLDQKLDLDLASKFIVYASQLDLHDLNYIPDKFQTYITNWCLIESKKFALTREISSRLYHFATLHRHLYWPKAGPCEQPWAEHIWTHLQNNFGIATLEFIETMIQNDRGILIENKYNRFFSQILFGTALEGLQLDQLTELKGVVGVNPLVVVMDEGVDVEAVEAAEMFIMVGVKGNGRFERFERLRNVEEELEAAILNTNISLQGRQLVTLRDVIDRTEEVTIVALLDVWKRGGIGDGIIINEEYYVARKLDKIFVRGSTIQKNKSDLFVIKTNITRDDFGRIYDKTPEEVVAINHPINERHKYILVNEHDDLDLDQLVNGNVHFLGETKLVDIYEWCGSFGSVDGIKPDMHTHQYDTIRSIHTESETIELKNISRHYKSHLLVISGVPGIGKTMCTKEIAYSISSNRWVLLVNLKDEMLYFKELLRCKTTTAEHHLQHFFKEIHCEMSAYIFVRKLRDKKVTIIFDGFDEIAPKFTKVVAEMIKIIRDAGFEMIVTTRTVLQEFVEQEFNTASLSLTPFDYMDIQCFIEAKLEDKKFRSGLIGDIKYRMFPFCSIPLHLMLVVDIAAEEFEKKIDTASCKVEINQLQLFKKYIEMKFALFSSKIGLINIDEQQIEKYHQYFAVETLFQNRPEDECIQLQTRMKIKLEDYEERLARGTEVTGLLVPDYKEGVFIHRSIAEYYAALWILDYSNKPEVEIKAVICLLKPVMLTLGYLQVRMFMELQCDSNVKRDEFINFVMEHQVDFNKYLTGNGSNALHVVAEDNYCNLAAILLTCGCDMNKTNNKGLTPLHTAIINKSNSVATLLISKGADVNCCDYLGKTPLHYAVGSSTKSMLFVPTFYETNILGIIESLLTKVVDIDSTTNDGITVMHYIARDRQLRENTAKEDYEDYKFHRDYYDQLAIKDYKDRFYYFLIEAMKLILEKNPDCNIRNKFGNTAVHIAASNFFPDILELILGVEGIDVNVRNKGGLTPLHIACYWGVYLNVLLLVANNADVNTCDDEGNTPLHVLMKRPPIQQPTNKGLVKYRKDYLKCIQALLANGANWNVKNKNGQSPYDLARRWSTENVLNRTIDYNDDGDDDDGNGDDDDDDDDDADDDGGGHDGGDYDDDGVDGDAMYHFYSFLFD